MRDVRERATRERVCAPDDTSLLAVDESLEAFVRTTTAAMRQMQELMTGLLGAQNEMFEVVDEMAYELAVVSLAVTAEAPAGVRAEDTALYRRAANVRAHSQALCRDAATLRIRTGELAASRRVSPRRV